MKHIHLKKQHTTVKLTIYTNFNLTIRKKIFY